MNEEPKATPQEMEAVRQRVVVAAEQARGRSPVVSDRVRVRADSFASASPAHARRIFTIVDLTETGVYAWPLLFADRAWLAEYYDYVGKASPEELRTAREAWEQATGKKTKT